MIDIEKYLELTDEEQAEVIRKMDAIELVKLQGLMLDRLKEQVDKACEIFERGKDD